MHKGLREPHLFNAGPNPLKLIRNLEGIIDHRAISALHLEIDRNVAQLFVLGEQHFNFAASIPKTEWRQRISRYYYGAYNVRRAVSLKHSGQYSTESSDHNKVDQLPDELENSATWRAKLPNLRDDRNLADYSHLAQQADLLMSPDEWELFVSQFIAKARMYLISKQVAV